MVIKGADLFVGGASALARKLKVSDLAIGLTVVAFGTSLPELSVNVMASIDGNASIAIGNIIGSNIANILLILGISAVIFPMTVTKGTVWKEIPLSLLAAILLGILANDKLIDKTGESILTRIDGLVLLSFFIIFLFYSFSISQQNGETQHCSHITDYPNVKIAILLVIGLIGLVAGGKLVVSGAVRLAAGLGVSQSIIGLTIVAVGTSIPELATSAVAAYKKNSDIAIGNVVGSNIFNIFFILGVSAEIRPLPIEPGTNRDIGVLIMASVLLMVFMFTGKRKIIDRWEAILFLVLYVGYVIFLVAG